MIPIERVFVGEIMSSPQIDALLPQRGARRFNAGIFLDIETVVHLRRGTQHGNYAATKGP
jgi:hypothetical protein